MGQAPDEALAQQVYVLFAQEGAQHMQMLMRTMCTMMQAQATFFGSTFGRNVARLQLYACMLVLC